MKFLPTLRSLTPTTPFASAVHDSTEQIVYNWNGCNTSVTNSVKGIYSQNP